MSTLSEMTPSQARRLADSCAKAATKALLRLGFMPAQSDKIYGDRQLQHKNCGASATVRREGSGLSGSQYVHVSIDGDESAVDFYLTGRISDHELPGHHQAMHDEPTFTMDGSVKGSAKLFAAWIAKFAAETVEAELAAKDPEDDGVCVEATSAATRRFKFNLLHCEDGPAEVWTDWDGNEHRRFYLYGQRLDEADWAKKVAKQVKK